MPSLPRLPRPSDLVGLAVSSVEALVALPSTVGTLNRAVLGLADAVLGARETFTTVQRLSGRMEALVDDLEGPVRALVPGLERLGRILDDETLEDLPGAIATIAADVGPIVAGLRDTQQKVAVIASSTDRIMSFVDDTSVRLGNLPGAGLLTRRRPSPPAGAAIAPPYRAPDDRVP